MSSRYNNQYYAKILTPKGGGNLGRWIGAFVLLGIIIAWWQIFLTVAIIGICLLVCGGVLVAAPISKRRHAGRRWLICFTVWLGLLIGTIALFKPGSVGALIAAWGGLLVVPVGLLLWGVTILKAWDACKSGQKKKVANP